MITQQNQSIRCRTYFICFALIGIVFATTYASAQTPKSFRFVNRKAFKDFLKKSDPVNNWVYAEMKYEDLSKLDSSFVFTQDEAGYGALFTCGRKGLTATFLVAPGDFRKILLMESRFVRVRTAKITFENGNELEARTAYMPLFKSAAIVDDDVVARVFENAKAATPVTVDVPRHDPVRITFPKPNLMFSYFVNGCPHAS